MKKYLMCALILCAIPAVAAAQVEVNCESCTHEVSVYMGEGGFIATADEDAKMVTWVSTCGGVTVSGELEPDDDGVVSELFTMGNGLACMDEKGGTFQLGPITDGGWFWVTDDMNSAVGGLVAKDILKNDMTPITSAGDGVTMMAGKGAVFLKETSSGRVGILPNILPEPPMAPAAICGPRRGIVWPYPYTDQLTAGCMLGDGGTKIRLVSPNANFGRGGMITDGMVTRPATGSAATITADLWVNESGSFSMDTDDTPPDHGWAGKDADNDKAQNNWIDATFSVVAASQAPNASTGGVTVTDEGTGSTPTGQATLSIAADDEYCPAKGTQHSVTVIVRAAPADNSQVNSGLHPAVATGKAAGFATNNGQAAAALLTVVCPPRSSANQGTELVPDNPFPPTTE